MTRCAEIARTDSDRTQLGPRRPLSAPILARIAAPPEEQQRAECVALSHSRATPGLAIEKSCSHALLLAPPSQPVLPIPPSGPIQNTSSRFGVRDTAAIGESTRITPGLAIRDGFIQLPLPTPASQALVQIHSSSPIQNTSSRRAVRDTAAIGEPVRAAPGGAIGKVGSSQSGPCTLQRVRTVWIID